MQTDIMRFGDWQLHVSNKRTGRQISFQNRQHKGYRSHWSSHRNGWSHQPCRRIFVCSQFSHRIWLKAYARFSNTKLPLLKKIWGVHGDTTK